MTRLSVIAEVIAAGRWHRFRIVPGVHVLSVLVSAATLLTACQANPLLQAVQQRVVNAKNAGVHYSVVYEPNGADSGTAPVDSNLYGQGQTVTVFGNTGSLIRSGFTFIGWNTAPNASGTTYSGGTTFTIGSRDVTLYADWTSNPTYTVTYDANGAGSGTVPVDNNRYEQAQAVTVLDNTGNLAETGYTFIGWNSAPDGSGTSYSAGDRFGMSSADLTLYAQWTLTHYSVIYNGNNNTVGSVTDSNTYTMGQTVSVLGRGTLGKLGYTFKDWNTKSSGSGTSYSAGNTFTIGAADVTLYAQWTAIPYTVTYNANGATGGSVPTDSNTYTIYQAVTVSGNTGNLTETGSTFEGWNTKADGSGYSYGPGGTMYIGNADVTLYAQWKENISYSVGDIGPAGGLIFYDKGAKSDGWEYLEAAPSDQSAGIQWYNGTSVSTGATGTAIGTGRSNTDKIVSAQGSGSYAAEVCADLTLHGYSDWFLPSKDELHLMEMEKGTIGGFASAAYYWSSSDYSFTTAWYEYFDNAYQHYQVKSYSYRVRAVRAF